MDFSPVSSSEVLGAGRQVFLSTMRKSASRTIVDMLKQSQSGHPGGSLSSLDILATLYAFRLTTTNERLVISHGHISPGVYSILAECGVIDAQEVIDTFRQAGSVYEGHITRHVPGIYYGTGPLGIGVSVAAGMALADRKQNKDRMTFAMMGDGEAQEGQIHEVALFAAKEKLSNLVVFCDNNHVQLSGSIADICPIDIPKIFEAHGWNVLVINGHDPEAIWQAVYVAEQEQTKPTMVVAQTVMGQGIPGMQADGEAHKSTWHGNAPKPELADIMLAALELTAEEKSVLKKFKQNRNYTPEPMNDPQAGDLMLDVLPGSQKLYTADTLTDCRSAYGNALLDLAQHNTNLLAGSADLGGSVKTDGVQKELPQQYIEYGIAEQNMVSVAGGLSLSGVVPFVSTFATFMTSRAKGQVRVNDINHVNVKMVSTHAGLSVGEDGPTHQCIDDHGVMQGLLDTYAIEPADPNHCDRMTRYMATHYGNMYMRMGRHKLPVLTTEDGNVLYDTDYQYAYGKTDVLRTGDNITIVTIGATAIEALRARESSGIDAEIIIVSSVKQFDNTLKKSLEKNKHVITVEDHNPYTGLGGAVARYVAEQGIQLASIQMLGVREYQLSGTAAALYNAVGIDAEGIAQAIQKI